MQTWCSLGVPINDVHRCVISVGVDASSSNQGIWLTSSLALYRETPNLPLDISKRLGRATTRLTCRRYQGSRFGAHHRAWTRPGPTHLLVTSPTFCARLVWLLALVKAW